MTLPRKPYNPKAPHRRVQTGDVQSQRDAFVQRLTILGAAPDVIDAVRENWDDPEWVERDQVVAMDDTALRAELDGIEREYHEGTHTEEEDEIAARLALEQAAAELAGLLNGGLGRLVVLAGGGHWPSAAASAPPSSSDGS